MKYVITFSKGTKICVITHQEEWGYFRCNSRAGVYVSSFEADNPVDFTGAGDAFGAGLMSLSSGKDIKDAVIFGNSLASIVIEKTGSCVLERMPSQEK